MGNKCSDCPVSEDSHSTTVSFLSFQWNSWHAQLLGVGGIIGILGILFLICLIPGILDCFPVCRSWTSRSSHLSRGHSLRQPQHQASYSIPLQPPYLPPASCLPSPLTAHCQNQWDREGMRQLMVQHQHSSL